MSKKGNSHSKQNMNEKLLAGIIIGVIVVLTVLTFLVGGKSLTGKLTQTSNTLNASPSSLPSYLRPKPTVAPGETVMVTVHGFVPEKLTVKKGTSVNFANFSDTDTVDVEADDPKMTMLNIGVIRNNDTSDPIQLAPGTYTYHNQLKPTQKGTIVVQ